MLTPAREGRRLDRVAVPAMNRSCRHPAAYASRNSGQFFGGEPWIVVPPTIARVSVTRQNSRIVRLLGSAALNEERSAPADA